MSWLLGEESLRRVGSLVFRSRCLRLFGDAHGGRGIARSLGAREGLAFSRYQTLSLQNFVCWKQVLRYGTKLTFLEFVDMIIVENLRV